MVDVFVPAEKRIINVLYAANKPLTTKNISERSEMSWQTAKNYLVQLQSKGATDGGRYGLSVYWWLRARTPR